MNDEKYDEIKSELRKLEEQEKECLSIKRALESEEDAREKELKAASMQNREIEEDWRKRNMIGNKGYLFSDHEVTLRKISSERNNLLSDGVEDLNQYMKKLSWKKDDYQKELSKLECDDYKEENKDGAYY